MSHEYEGIIIFGTPRSGTTLLRRLLDAHPNITCPPETCLFSACARFLHSERVADGLDFGVLTGLAFAGFEPEAVRDRLREFAFAFKREHAGRAGKARWAEKTAVDAFHVGKIEALCGDTVQYVCLVRHGLDVACSMRDLSDRGYTYLSELHEYVKRYPRPLEAFAHAWVDVNRALLDFVERHPDNSILLRYEELVADPQREMQRLLAFLGEPWTDELLHDGLENRHDAGLGDWKTYDRTGIDAASVGSWKSLPRPIVSTLGEICNPVLQACGYETVEVMKADSAENARRRYQLGLMLGGDRHGQGRD
ncbi:MAG TPA: sulfotransferase [Gammaproteobacteria bacterium]|nr:sulfotransferase [Gammaproteobacteria bacterium]